MLLNDFIMNIEAFEKSHYTPVERMHMEFLSWLSG